MIRKLFLAGTAATLAIAATTVTTTATAKPTPAKGPHAICTPSAAATPALTMARKASLDRLLDDMERTGQAPGAVVLIEQRGRLVYARTLGMADREGALPMHDDALFRIYSMTKPVTSLAALQLVDRGTLALDTPVSRFIPEFAATRVWLGTPAMPAQTAPLARPLTVRDLLTHGAGMVYAEKKDDPVHRLYVEHGIPAGPGVAPTAAPGAAPITTTAELARAIAAIPLANQPGTRFTYGNAADVLGRVVEVASGERLADYVERHIFVPLGMRSTSFHPRAEDRARMTSAYAGLTQAKGKDDEVLFGVDPGSLKPAMLMRIDEGAKSIFFNPSAMDFGGAGSVSTAGDYLKFTQMLRQDGRLGAVRLLSPGLARAMRSDQLTGEARANAKSLGGVGFGFGLAVKTTPTDAAPLFPRCGAFWGGAGSTFFWIDPVGETSGVVMTQVFGGDVKSSWLAMIRALYTRSR